MAETAADVLIDTLHQWRVEVIFGLPGDGINGIMEALRTHQEQIRCIQVEYFFDHVRLERILFDGWVEQRGGVIQPDVSRPGTGLEVERADAARYAA